MTDRTALNLFFATAKSAMPTIPKISLEVMRLCRQSTVDRERIVEALVKDQALALKVLRIANSAFFGYKGTVTSVDAAVVIVGIHTERTTAVSEGMIRAFPTVPHLDFASYWQHALLTASLAEQLGRALGVDPDEASTAGLLHGVGVLLLHLWRPDAAGEIVREVPPLAFGERAQRERELLGFDANDVAEELVRRWELPLSLAPHGGSNNFDNDANVVKIASKIATELVTGRVTEGEITKPFAISPSHFQRMCEVARAYASAIAIS